jgi:hypothetical protein
VLLYSSLLLQNEQTYTQTRNTQKPSTYTQDNRPTRHVTGSPHQHVRTMLIVLKYNNFTTMSMTLGSTQPLSEMSTGNLPGG